MEDGCTKHVGLIGTLCTTWQGHTDGITAVTWKRMKVNLTCDRCFCTMPKYKLASWDTILYLNLDEHSKCSVMTLHKTGWRERKHGHLFCQFFYRESMVLQLENTQDWKDKCEPLFCEFPLENYGASQADLWENNTDSPRSAVTLFFRTCVPRHTFFFVSNLAISTGFRLATVVRTKTVTQAWARRQIQPLRECTWNSKSNAV